LEKYIKSESNEFINIKEKTCSVDKEEPLTREDFTSNSLRPVFMKMSDIDKKNNNVDNLKIISEKNISYTKNDSLFFIFTQPHKIKKVIFKYGENSGH